MPATSRRRCATTWPCSGWGYDAETTFFTTEELIEKFSLERVSRSPAVFDEQKLSWMNGHYIRELDPDELARRTAEYMERMGIPGGGHPQLERAVAAVQDKVSTLAEVPRLVGFAFGPIEIDQAAWDKVMGKDGAAEALPAARGALADVEPFDEQHTEEALRRAVETPGREAGALFQPLRVALTGQTVSAGIFESLALLGREEVADADRCRPRPPQKLNTAVNSSALAADSGSRWQRVQQGSRIRQEAEMEAQPFVARTRRPALPTAHKHNEGHGRRLTAAFEALEAFPALAESRKRVLRVVSQDQPSVTEMVTAIESDVALVIAVMRLANKRADGRGRVRSIPQAIEVLTPAGVEALIGATKTFDFFERTPLWDAAPERFRLHSVATQRAADRLCSRIEFPDRDELLVSSLLHDIGKLVLVQAYPGYPGPDPHRGPHARAAHPRRAP